MANAFSKLLQTLDMVLVFVFLRQIQWSLLDYSNCPLFHSFWGLLKIHFGFLL
jgi:hypothetical protein